MVDMFSPPPEPPTELGRYRILSSTAGARVSPLCLGAMSIGEAWKDFLGSMDKETSFKLLDAYYEAGGNFIDTANNYQNDESEKWIGEWAKARKIRDQLFIATKFTSNYKSYDIGKQRAANYTGNSRKSLFHSVKDSLAKLDTDYIDLLYLHWWDWTTSIPEVMDSLHMLVEQGKVLYLGISDTPAWIVSAANTYAVSHGKTPFSVYQGRWNVMMRDFERDIIPMARHFGMALCPWDVLGGGRLQSSKQIAEKKKAGEGLRAVMGGPEQSEQEKKVSEALEKVAGEHGIESIQSIALAYVMQKTPSVFPIIGGRKVEHLKSNIEALKIHLTDKQIEYIESVQNFDVGFPGNFVGDDPRAGPAAPIVSGAAPVVFAKLGKPIGHD